MDKKVIMCCPANKESQLIEFRNYKTKDCGFYVTTPPTGSGYYRRQKNNRSVMIHFCPFCGKDFKRLLTML